MEKIFSRGKVSKQKSKVSGVPLNIIKKYIIKVWQPGEQDIDQERWSTMGIC